MKTRFGTPPPVPALGIDPTGQTQAGPKAMRASTDNALAPGTVIGHYELIREIGRGGMGVVCAARDTQLARRVAIKFLLDANKAVAERFLVEARATALCTHDNIVVIHEIDQHAGLPYMVLEYLEGMSLRQKLGVTGTPKRMPASRVVEIMLPVARALARAHDQGIVHRDLKPENIFLTDAGQVKVLDFGIAKALGPQDARARVQGPQSIALAHPALTEYGTIVGTLPYMSPEQMGRDQVDHRSDLWAAGIIMFEMLAGRHPVDPFTMEALLTAAASDSPFPSIADVVADVPPPLVRLIDKLLAKKKADRLASAEELVRKLEELVPPRRRRELAEGEGPYPGLVAFQEHDADRFFGRERDVERMIARVREHPLTVVAGPSGAGKSSFVRAGIAPALKAGGERWEMLAVRPGRQPIAALASILERIGTKLDVANQVAEHAQLVAKLRSDPTALGALLRARVRESEHSILLFVDQFEELYTLVPNAAERKAFTAALSAAADDTGAPIRVVLSMRSDFLDRLGEDPRFRDEVSRGLQILSAADRDSLKEALLQPLQLVGYRFESAVMVEEMLDELEGAPGALPLLQFAASKLWDQRDTDRKMLTVASYRGVGGVTGALAAHADEVLATMDANGRALAARIFRQLVTPERTRAIVEMTDLEHSARDRAEVTRVVDRFVSARLLVVQARETGSATVEIVHESLIDRWPTLRRWIEEDQEDAAFLAQLATAAKQWDAMQRAPGLLWRGEAMEQARRWYAAEMRELSERDQAFLDEVFALARRGKRWRRIALTAVLVTLTLIAGGASFAYVRVHAAEGVASANAEKANRALASEREEEQLRKDADAKRSAALAALLSAEARSKAAEEGLLSAQDAASAAEAEKRAAEQRAAELAAQAAHPAAAAPAAPALTREQLEAKNAELEAALKDAKTAREKAEHSSQEAERAKADLQQALAVQKARADKLEQDKKKISTELK